MKSKDIKVGGIYAYNRYRSYSGLAWTHAVKVIAVGKKKAQIKFVDKVTFEEIDVSNPRVKTFFKMEQKNKFIDFFINRFESSHNCDNGLEYE